MKTIHHSLTIGEPVRGLDLFCNVGINGRHLFRLHCESFIGLFLRDIHAMMHGGRVPKFVTGGRFYSSDYRVYDTIIDSISVDGSVVLHTPYDPFSGADRSLNPNSEQTYVVVWGAAGTPEINGLWEVESTTNSNRAIRLANGPMDINPANYAGQSAAIVGKAFRNLQVINNTDYPFRDIHPVLGTGNRPVSVADLFLERPLIGLVSTGGRSISGLITDQQRSKFTISQPFTNASGADISITELGLYTPLRSVNGDELYSCMTLYARDVLASALNLPDGQTLSLDYEVSIDLENFNQDTDQNGSNGGFTENFALALRKNAAAYRDTYLGHLLRLVFGGGTSVVKHDNNIPSWKFGIRLGESNKFVSMTDQQLSPDADEQTPYAMGGITHGSGDGQLFHHGMVMDDVPTFDGGANEAFFNISRVFENRGSTPLTIKEIGMYANMAEHYTAYTPSLIARKALAAIDQFTIQPGQAMQVNYKVKLVV